MCTIRGGFRKFGSLYPVDQVFTDFVFLLNISPSVCEGYRQPEHIHPWDLEFYTPKLFSGHQTRRVHNTRLFPKVWKVLSGGSVFHRFRAFESLIFSLVKDIASPNINFHSWDLELYTPKPFLGHQTRSMHNMRWFSKVWKVLSNGSDFHRFHVFAQNLTFNLVKISPARTYPPMGSGDCILKTFLRAPDKQCTQYKVVPERRECFIRWIRFRRFCVFELISMFTGKGTSALTKIHSWDLNLWTPKLL